MIRELTAAIALLACSCSPVAAPKTSISPARIQFEQTTIDLGDVAVRREPYEVQFAFRNRGLDSLKINQLEPSCACADAGISNALLRPEETGSVGVKILVDQPGARSARVTVHSNDPQDPRVTLDVTWRALAPIEFDPVRVNFGVVRPGTRNEQTITLLYREEEDESNCQVISMHSASEELDVTFQRPLHGRTRTVRVSLTSGTESGQYAGAVRAILNGCPTDQILLPVEWTVRDAIETWPRRLMLGFGEPGDALRKKLIVTCDPDKTLEVSAVTLHELSWIDATTEPASERLSMIILAGTLPHEPGDHAGELHIHCSLPEERVLVVPVTAVVRSGNQTTASPADP